MTWNVVSGGVYRPVIFPRVPVTGIESVNFPPPAGTRNRVHVTGWLLPFLPYLIFLVT